MDNRVLRSYKVTKVLHCTYVCINTNVDEVNPETCSSSIISLTQTLACIENCAGDRKSFPNLPVQLFKVTLSFAHFSFSHNFARALRLFYLHTTLFATVPSMCFLPSVVTYCYSSVLLILVLSLHGHFFLLGHSTFSFAGTPGKSSKSFNDKVAQRQMI